jgi:glyoxylase-like metal-dependent hydrolase (beta-lactamase superfamily II)
MTYIKLNFHIVRQTALLVLLVFSLSVSYATETVMKLIQVAPQSYYVEGVSALGSQENKNFISNAGVVIAPEGVVVIDALGSPALAEMLVAEIKKLTPKPIQHVIVTHYHADHVYGLQVFADLGAKIIAQENGREYLNSDTAKLRLQASKEELAPWVNEQTRLVEATRWVSQDETLQLSGMTFQLLMMGPAHTPDDLAVFVPEQNVLFAGDLVFRGRIPFVGTADSAGWIKSLDRLLSVQAKTIVPGHGPSSNEAKQDLIFTRDYLVFLRESLYQGARDLEPFDEVYNTVDWSTYQSVPLFNAANRMNAYNVYLSIQSQ